jgi:hypothetical protein
MITISKTRFLKVFGLIFEAYVNRQGLFAEHTADTSGPQKKFWPNKLKKGSKEHLYWLALVALSDRRTNSTHLYKNFARMFDEDQTLFVQDVQPSLEKATELFRAYQIALPVKEIRLFLERKQHLDMFFDGDPLKIYEGVDNVSDLMQKLSGIGKANGIKIMFPGAKEKISSLLAMFINEHVEIEFKDLVPIDVWVQSISASTCVLRGEGKIWSKVLSKQLRPLMVKLFSPHVGNDGASNATWILGKFGCTHCNHLDMSKLCPVYQMCKGPFERAYHHESGNPIDAIQLPLKLKGKCEK